MAAAVEAQHARPVAGGVGAAAAGHLREHVLGGGLELRREAAVALDVAVRDLGGVRAVRTHVEVAQHLARARGRVVALEQLDARAAVLVGRAAAAGRAAARVALRVGGGRMEAPRAVVRGEGVLPIEKPVRVIIPNPNTLIPTLTRTLTLTLTLTLALALTVIPTLALTLP